MSSRLATEMASRNVFGRSNTGIAILQLERVAFVSCKKLAPPQQ
jgi:hypothetical protein